MQSFVRVDGKGRYAEFGGQERLPEEEPSKWRHEGK